MNTFLKGYYTRSEYCAINGVKTVVEAAEEISTATSCTSLHADADAEEKAYEKLTMHLETKRLLVRVELQLSASKFAFLSCFGNKARDQRLFG